MKFPDRHTYSFTTEEYLAYVKQANEDGYVYYPRQGYDLKKFNDDLWWGFCPDGPQFQNGSWILSQDPFQQLLVLVFSADLYRIDQAIHKYWAELEMHNSFMNKQRSVKNKINEVIRQSHSR